MPEIGPEQGSFQVLLSGPARRDIAAILRKSLSDFGLPASLRYNALILQALRDIGVNSNRPGSKEHPEIMLPGARTYHLAFSRRHGTGVGVKEPCHIILYRHQSERLIQIGRILHDSRDLIRHLPEDFKS